MSLPHARICGAQRRAASAPPRAGSSVQRGLLRSGGLQGSAASGWGGLGQRIQMGPRRGHRRSTSLPQAGAGRAEGGATVARRPAPEGPEEASWAGGRALLRGVPASPSPPRPPDSVAPPPPRALSTGRAAAPPRSRRLLPAPTPRAPLPQRGRREPGGGEGVKPGLFPARRDPEPSRARC